eukprot:Tamp_26351.p1 GENE.Tamp_26351~~Tamp_26351.p1  ORF type:complete len:271 (+),score=68.39 Tamp_26351:25-813(+)
MAVCACAGRPVPAVQAGARGALAILAARTRTPPRSTTALRLRGGAPEAVKSGGLFAASVTRWEHEDVMQESPVHLTFAVNTTAVSWIGRSTVKEVMALVMRKCVESTSPGDFARVEHELQGKKAYCFVVSRQSGIAATVMTDARYPERVAINFLDMLLDEFTQIFGTHISQSPADNSMDFPELEERMAEFQDPSSADVIERIKNDMYQSEKVLQKNVESILERGQKLEDLIMQSEQLSKQTKIMYSSVTKSPGWFEDCCGIV